MKDFLIGIFATAAIIVACSCVETIYEPVQKTGGSSGTQSVGESDLVLPGGGEDMATVQDIPVYNVTADSGMTEMEKLELIDAMLTDAFAYFGDLEETQAWEVLAVCINSVLNFGGVAGG